MSGQAGAVRCRRATFVAAIVLTALPAVGAAQEGSLVRVRPEVGAAWPSSSAGSNSAVGILASAVVPGAGQALGGRWLTAAAFAAVEVAGWWIYSDSRGDGDRFRGAYKDLAWTVARQSPEPRVDGPFEYYERMAHWTRSGAFDADPATPDLQPERGVDAYNGVQWKLAADIFLEGDLDAPPTAPGYPAALAFYRERAYPEGLVWDWSGRTPEQQRFARLIEDSDDAFGRASVALGAVVANHVLSAVEAYVVHRLAGDRVDLDVSPGSPSSREGVTLRVRIRSPR